MLYNRNLTENRRTERTEILFKSQPTIYLEANSMGDIFKG